MFQDIKKNNQFTLDALFSVLVLYKKAALFVK